MDTRKQRDLWPNRFRPVQPHEIRFTCRNFWDCGDLRASGHQHFNLAKPISRNLVAEFTHYLSEMGSHPREFREGQNNFGRRYGAHGRTVTGLFEASGFDGPMKQSRPNKLEPNLTGNESTRDLGSLLTDFKG